MDDRRQIYYSMGLKLLLRPYNELSLIKRPYNESSEIIGHDEDLLLQILINLPWKSVIKFKSVSMLWYRLISDPEFVHLYQNHYYHMNSNYPPPPIWAFLYVPSILVEPCKHKRLDILVQFGSDEDKSNIILNHADFSFLDDPDNWGYVVGTFNDLVLCGVGERSIRRHYYVCNATTKEFATVPLPPPFTGSYFNVIDAFVCQPEENTSNCNNQRYRFRVVRMKAAHNHSLEFELMIFASETGIWTQHKLEHYLFPKQLKQLVACHSSGLVMSLCRYGSYSHILIFDPFMATEESVRLIRSDRVNMPVGYNADSDEYPIQLTATQGRIFLSQILYARYNPYHVPTLFVWELLQVGQGEWNWNLVRRIPFSEMSIIENGVKIPNPLPCYDIVSDDDKCFLSNYVKNLGKYNPRHLYLSHILGFDPTDANIIFIIISAPDLSFETLASCNFLTRSI